MKRQDKGSHEIACRNCQRRLNSDQVTIKIQKEIAMVRQLGKIHHNVIPQEVYIAECPYCGATLAEEPIYTQGVRRERMI